MTTAGWCFILFVVCVAGVAGQANLRPDDDPNAVAGAAFVDQIETKDKCTGCAIDMDPVLSSSVVAAKISTQNIQSNSDEGFTISTVGGVNLEGLEDAKISAANGSIVLNADVNGDISFFGENSTVTGQQVEITTNEDIFLNSDGDINFSSPGGIGETGDLTIMSQFHTSLTGINGVNIMSEEKDFAITAGQGTIFFDANDIIVGAGDPEEEDRINFSSQTKIDHFAGSSFFAQAGENLNTYSVGATVVRSPVNDVQVDAQNSLSVNSQGAAEFISENHLTISSFQEMGFNADTVMSVSGHSVNIDANDQLSLVSATGSLTAVSRGKIKIADGQRLNDYVSIQALEINISSNEVTAVSAESSIFVEGSDDSLSEISATDSMTLQTDFESGSILLVSDEEDVQFEVAAGKGAIAFKAVDGDVEFGVEKLAGDIDFTARSIYLNAEDEFFVQGETVSFEAESIVLDAYGGFSFDTTETLSFDGNINFKSTGDFTFDSAAGIVLEADEAAGLLSMGYLRSLKTNDGELIFFDFDNTIQFRGDYRADLRADSDIAITASTNVYSGLDTYVWGQNGVSIMTQNLTVTAGDENNEGYVTISVPDGESAYTGSTTLTGGQVRFYSDSNPEAQGFTLNAPTVTLEANDDFEWHAGQDIKFDPTGAASFASTSFSNYLRNDGSGSISLTNVDDALFASDGFTASARGSLALQATTDFSVKTADGGIFLRSTVSFGDTTTMNSAATLTVLSDSDINLNGGDLSVTDATGLSVTASGDILVSSDNQQLISMTSANMGVSGGAQNITIAGQEVDLRGAASVNINTIALSMTSWADHGYNRDIDLKSGKSWTFSTTDGNFTADSDNLWMRGSKSVDVKANTDIGISTTYDLQFVSGKNFDIDAASVAFTADNKMTFSANLDLTATTAGAAESQSCEGTAITRADVLEIDTPENIIFSHVDVACNSTEAPGPATILLDAERGSMKMINDFADGGAKVDSFDISASKLVQFIGGELSWESTKEWINMTSPIDVKFTTANLEDNSQLPIGRDNKILGYGNDATVIHRADDWMTINVRGIHEDVQNIDQDWSILLETGLGNIKTGTGNDKFIDIIANDGAILHDASSGMRFSTGDRDSDVPITNQNLDVIATRDIVFDASSSIRAFAGGSKTVEVNDGADDYTTGIAFISESGDILVKSEGGSVTYRSKLEQTVKSLENEITMNAYGDFSVHARGDTRGSIIFNAEADQLEMRTGNDFTSTSGTSSYPANTLLWAHDEVNIHSADEQRYRVTGPTTSDSEFDETDADNQYGFEFLAEQDSVVVLANDGNIEAQISGYINFDAKEGSQYFTANDDVRLMSNGGSINFLTNGDVLVQVSAVNEDLVFSTRGDAGTVEVIANSNMDILVDAASESINLSSNSSTSYISQNGDINSRAFGGDIVIKNTGEDQDFQVLSRGSVSFDSLGTDSGAGIQFKGENFFGEADFDVDVTGNDIMIGIASNMGSGQTRPRFEIHAGGDDTLGDVGIGIDTTTSGTGDIIIATDNPSNIEIRGFTVDISTQTGPIDIETSGPIYFNNTVASGALEDVDPDEAKFRIETIENGDLLVNGQLGVIIAVDTEAEFIANNGMKADTQANLALLAERNMNMEGKTVSWNSGARAVIRGQNNRITTNSANSGTADLQVTSNIGDGADFEFISDFTFDMKAGQSILIDNDKTGGNMEFRTEGSEANLVIRAYDLTASSSIVFTSADDMVGTGRVVDINGGASVILDASDRLSLDATDAISIVANDFLGISNQEDNLDITSGDNGVQVPEGQAPINILAEGNLEVKSGSGRDIVIDTTGSQAAGAPRPSDVRFTAFDGISVTQTDKNSFIEISSKMTADLSAGQSLQFANTAEELEIDGSGFGQFDARNKITSTTTASDAGIELVATDLGKIVVDVANRFDVYSDDDLLMIAEQGIAVLVDGEDSAEAISIIGEKSVFVTSQKEDITVNGQNGVRLLQTGGASPLTMYAKGKDGSGNAMLVTTTKPEGDIIFESVGGAVSFEGSSSVDIQATAARRTTNEGFVRIEGFATSGQAVQISATGTGSHVDFEASGAMNIVGEESVQLTATTGNVYTLATRSFQASSVGRGLVAAPAQSSGIHLTSDSLVKMNSGSDMLLDSQAGPVFLQSKSSMTFSTSDFMDFRANNIIQLSSGLDQATGPFEDQFGIAIQSGQNLDFTALNDDVRLTSGQDTSITAGGTASFDAEDFSEFSLEAPNGDITMTATGDFSLEADDAIEISADNKLTMRQDAQANSFDMAAASGVVVSTEQTVGADIWLVAAGGDLDLTANDRITISGRATVNNNGAIFDQRGLVDFQPSGPNNNGQAQFQTEFMRIPVIRLEGNLREFRDTRNQDLPREEDFQTPCIPRQFAVDVSSLNLCICISGNWLCRDSI